MSKIKKGIKVLVTQGPAGIWKAVRNSKEAKIQEERFRMQAKSFHLVSEEELERQKLFRFDHPVTFSILTPLYNTPKQYLKELVDSLQKQSYPNWELCLADGSDEEHCYVGDICRAYAQSDNRIIYTVLQENKGISENTNECIKMASGSYFGLLDHDDVLHPSALFEMMRAIEKEHADFLYSDEVKFSGDIREAVDFNFKPDFGKDELRSHNFICHFTVFSRNLLGKTGQVYRSEFDGSQDHDMVLRLTEQAQKVVHIPKVLYYWRVHQNSVSMNLDSKLYAVDAAIRAVGEQLKRCGEFGTVASNLPYQTIYRIRYDIPDQEQVAVFLHHMQETDDFEKISREIKERTSYQNLKFYPVYGQTDICLQDGSNGTKWNQLISETNAPYIVLLHAKCYPLTDNWIEELLMFAQRRDVCGVSPKILYKDKTICYAGIALDSDKSYKLRFLCEHMSDEEQGFEAMLRHVRNTTSAFSGCMMVKKTTLQQMGMFSESLPEYEDVDLSLRAEREGLLNVWTCFAKMELQLPVRDQYQEVNIRKFVNRWDDRLQKEDPYCHPILKELSLL